MMTTALRVGVIGDYNVGYPSHLATNEALGHAAKSLGRECECQWLPTESLTGEDGKAILARYDALFCAPGSPYASMEGALRAIRYAREHDRPFLGTCGGFQHAMIEYARNVLGITEAEHEETAPGAGELVISKLVCSLAGQQHTVYVTPGSRARHAYGRDETVEEFRCNYGLNPAYQERLRAGGLCVSGVDENGEARIVELPDHRFFMATLFVPQLTSRADAPHPLIAAYLRAAM